MIEESSSELGLLDELVAAAEKIQPVVPPIEHSEIETKVVAPYESKDPLTNKIVETQVGKWRNERERLEVPKNVVYATNEIFIRNILNARDAEHVTGVLQKYKTIFRDQDIFSVHDNRICAAVAIHVARVNLELLSQLSSDDVDKEINGNDAIQLCNAYIELLIDKINTALSSTETNINKDDIEIELIPFLLEAIKKSIDEIHEKIKRYKSFAHEVYQDSDDVIKNKINDLERRLMSVETQSTEKRNVNNSAGWIFYSASYRYKTETENLLITSHAPDIDWEGWHKRSEMQSGALVYGRPIKFFSHDMQTTHEELQMGEDWTLEKGTGTFASSEKELNEINMHYELYVSNSLQQAWDDKNMNGEQDAYTEIWLRDAEPYAIWLDKDWQRTFWPGVLKILPAKLQSLLESRPDLPVFIVDRQKKQIEVASRDYLFDEIQKVM